MKLNPLLSAIFLIAGTSIGAGMLALPVSTAAYGMLPAAALFCGCWFIMMLASLLALEVSLWHKPGSNLISMAHDTLGGWGKAVAWLSFLSLLYALMAAYMTGLNAMLGQWLAYYHLPTENISGTILLIGIFACAIFFGPKPVDCLNRLFMLGLVVAFLSLSVLIGQKIEVGNVPNPSPEGLWMALPVIATAFGFSIVIPSLRNYLYNDVKRLRLAIIFGSVLPLLVYLLWEVLVLAAVPESVLLNILQTGEPVVGLTSALKQQLTHSVALSVFLQLFGFCAVATSFIGVSFSLFDFLADGLRVEKSRWGRGLLLLTTFTPPALFALLYPNGFIIALRYGSIFVVILLCLLPAAMAISGRYGKNQHIVPAGSYRLSGGVATLAMIIAFALLVIGVEIWG